MKNMPIAEIVDNEGGFVLVAAMMILVILVIIGISATNTTNIEYRIAVNDRVAKEDFYNQETCLASGRIQFRTWLTTAFITTAETAAFFPPAGADVNANGINDLSECVDQNGIVVGSYKVKNVENSGTDIAGWEDIANFVSVADHPANNFPVMEHKDKPDPGSGYDPRNFEIRRFAITSYSPDNDKNVVLQEGVYKVFNKF